MGDYELYHAATRKHKYIKKIGNRYFYSQQEIDAYYQDKKPKDAKELALDVRGGASRVKNTALMAPYVKNQPAQQPVEKNLKGKKSGKFKEVKEAVAEATGKRDVYWEAPKVTENGRTFYDDEAATLRRGKKDKRGKVDTDGTVYTNHNTMQYDNRYTEERNRKTRERGRKKLKNMATKPIRNLKKQASKGRKAVNKFYRNNVKPQTHVVYSDGTSKRLD